MNRQFWTDEELKILTELYPKTTAKDIAERLNKKEGSVYNKAFVLGLKKDEDFKRETSRQMALKNGSNSRFKKGLIPFNKGKKIEEYLPPEKIEKLKKTSFKKGNIPHNTKYDGYERISKDGYVEVRVAPGKFVLKHRLIWEEHFGSIPKGKIIIFKDGDKTNLDISNLEMIDREENAIRNNNLPGYPRELQKVDYLRVKLKNKIKNGKKQN